MNLIRMLRVSDTFTAGEIPMGRYHIVGLKALPRFARGVPAVREAARPGSGLCPPVEAGEAPTGATGLEAPAGEGSGSAVSREDVGGAQRGGWLSGVIHWLAERFQRRRNPFGCTGPRLSRTVVPSQGCLRLDGVKVVRNDLSDTDFEVRPARRPATGKPTVSEEAALPCDFRAPSMVVSEPSELRAGNL